MPVMNHVALVTEESRIGFSELTRVSAALQKQVMNDYFPIWGINATVDAFQSLDDVPVGSWPLIIMDQIGTPQAEGVHEDQNGHPIALVKFDDGWSLTASHECIEMLTDPDGNRTIAGQSPIDGQGRVEFLAEPCDPSEDASFSYTIDGVMVSDFYTPHYFDPAANSGVQYSFTGAIEAPLQVLENGYLSWHDPVSDHWFQQTNFNGDLQFPDLGVMSREKGSFRSQIVTRTGFYKNLVPKKQHAAALTGLRKTIDRSKKSKAEAWRRRIKEIAG